MEWKTYLPVSISKPKKKKSFFQEELVSSDLEETVGSGSPPKMKKSFRKELVSKGQFDKTYNLQKPAGLPNKIFTSVTVGHPERVK